MAVSTGLIGAVAKRLDHQRIESEFGKCVAGSRIVHRASGEPVTAEPIGQSRQQRALAEPARPFVQVLGEEAVAAHGHDAGGRRGDRDGVMGAVEPDGIFGIDIVARRCRHQ